MNARRWISLVVLAAALCAVMLPASSTSAKVKVGGNYPYKNSGLIKTITTATGTSGVDEFPLVSFETMNAAKAWQKPFIDRNTEIAANPSSFMNKYSEPGEIRRGSLVLVDMWVFRINFQNSAGDIILNPWSYRAAKEIQYANNTFTIQLNSAVVSSAGYKMENFGLRFMDMIANYNNSKDGQYYADDWERDATGNPTKYIGPPEFGPINTGPKETLIQRNLDNGSWHFTTRSEGASEDYIEAKPDIVNAAEQQIIFDNQWPAIYCLYYFDTPEFLASYGSQTEGEKSGPINTLTATRPPKGAETPNPSTAPGPSPSGAPASVAPNASATPKPSGAPSATSGTSSNATTAPPAGTTTTAPPANNNNNAGEGGGGDSPKTGDVSLLPFALVGIAMVAGMGFVLRRREEY
ncbi:MAG: LPXTG cell wall anchor domain-containing protein [Clostridia bacterium]|nr:LPXTG cell wall anchor domain-containing protein [Clostridia bacterium]